MFAITLAVEDGRRTASCSVHGPIDVPNAAAPETTDEQMNPVWEHVQSHGDEPVMFGWSIPVDIVGPSTPPSTRPVRPLDGRDVHPDARWMIIHFDQPVPKGIAGHAFGPFESAADAEAFVEGVPADECYSIAVTIVGPEQRDLDAHDDDSAPSWPQPRDGSKDRLS